MSKPKSTIEDVSFVAKLGPIYARGNLDDAYDLVAKYRHDAQLRGRLDMAKFLKERLAGFLDLEVPADKQLELFDTALGLLSGVTHDELGEAVVLAMLHHSAASRLTYAQHLLFRIARAKKDGMSAEIIVNELQGALEMQCALDTPGEG